MESKTKNGRRESTDFQVVNLEIMTKKKKQPPSHHINAFLIPMLNPYTVKISAFFLLST